MDYVIYEIGKCLTRAIYMYMVYVIIQVCALRHDMLQFSSSDISIAMAIWVYSNQK